MQAGFTNWNCQRVKAQAEVHATHFESWRHTDAEKL